MPLESQANCQKRPRNHEQRPIASELGPIKRRNGCLYVDGLWTHLRHEHQVNCEVERTLRREQEEREAEVVASAGEDRAVTRLGED
jgi:hypothetical protein